MEMLFLKVKRYNPSLQREVLALQEVVEEVVNRRKEGSTKKRANKASIVREEEPMEKEFNLAQWEQDNVNVLELSSKIPY